MSQSAAELAIDFMFQMRVEERNLVERRQLQFVIATNLAYLSEEVLTFCEAHGVYFSTSLDGPRELHNRNRPRPGGDSYELTIDGIRRVRERLGHDRH
jgi:sulfatase maturation enzyme AslB (radical SAM superfamily)